jgi:hypothetical protein
MVEVCSADAGQERSKPGSSLESRKKNLRNQQKFTENKTISLISSQIAFENQSRVESFQF